MKYKTMSIKKFVDEGYLIELNRSFLHPLGLSILAVEKVPGDYTICILDNRDSLTGMLFEKINKKNEEKIKRIEKEWIEKVEIRKNSLGFIIQPLPSEYPDYLNQTKKVWKITIDGDGFLLFEDKFDALNKIKKFMDTLPKGKEFTIEKVEIQGSLYEIFMNKQKDY